MRGEAPHLIRGISSRRQICCVDFLFFRSWTFDKAFLKKEESQQNECYFDLHELKSLRFCRDLLNLPIPRAKSTANLVMALASYRSATSVVELSLSPLYRYQYSSISKSIAALGSKERQALRRYLIQRMQPSMRILQTDTTPMRKPHSPTLRERTYITLANNEVIQGNRPLSVGYEISFINASDGNWSLPLSIRRVAKDETATDCAIKQLGELLAHADKTKAAITINLLDSKYGKAAYFAPSYAYENLVSIARLRLGRRVWERKLRRGPRGGPGIYGQQYYLQLEDDYTEYTDNKTREKRSYYRHGLLTVSYTHLTLPTKIV